MQSQRGILKSEGAPRRADLSVRFSSDVSSPVLPEKKDDVLPAADPTTSNLSEFKVSQLEDKALSTDEALSSKPKRSNLKLSNDASRSATSRSVQFNLETESYFLPLGREKVPKEYKIINLKEGRYHYEYPENSVWSINDSESIREELVDAEDTVEHKSSGLEEKDLSNDQGVLIFKKPSSRSYSLDEVAYRCSAGFEIYKLVRQLQQVFEESSLSGDVAKKEIAELSKYFKQVLGGISNQNLFDDAGALTPQILDEFSSKNNHEARQAVVSFYNNVYALLFKLIWADNNELTLFILKQLERFRVDIKGQSINSIRDQLLKIFLSCFFQTKQTTSRLFVDMLIQIFSRHGEIIGSCRSKLIKFEKIKYDNQDMQSFHNKLLQAYEATLAVLLSSTQHVNKVFILQELIEEATQAKTLSELMMALAKLKYPRLFHFLNKVKKFNNSIAIFYSEEFENLVLNDANDKEFKTLHKNLRLVYQAATNAFAAIEKLREFNLTRQDPCINKIIYEYTETLEFLCKTKDVVAIKKLRTQINTTTFELNQSEKNSQEIYSKVVRSCAKTAEKQLAAACEQAAFDSIGQAGKKVLKEAVIAIDKASSKPKIISNISKGIRASALLVRKPTFQAVKKVARAAEIVPVKFSKWKAALGVLCLLGAGAAIIAIPFTLGGSAPVAAKLAGVAAGLLVASGLFFWGAQASNASAAMQDLTTTAVNSGVVTRAGLFKRPAAAAPTKFSDDDYVFVDAPEAAFKAAPGMAH